MNKLNLPPFYIGQKVVYITGNNMPKDTVHTVTAIRSTCLGKCFEIQINNSPHEILQRTTIIHCDCGQVTIVGAGHEIYWDSKSFRPLQQQNFPLIKLSKIMKKEKEEILIPN